MGEGAVRSRQASERRPPADARVDSGIAVSRRRRSPRPPRGCVAYGNGDAVSSAQDKKMSQVDPCACIYVCICSTSLPYVEEEMETMIYPRMVLVGCGCQPCFRRQGGRGGIPGPDPYASRAGTTEAVEGIEAQSH